MPIFFGSVNLHRYIANADNFLNTCPVTIEHMPGISARRDNSLCHRQFSAVFSECFSARVVSRRYRLFAHQI